MTSSQINTSLKRPRSPKLAVIDMEKPIKILKIQSAASSKKSLDRLFGDCVTKEKAAEGKHLQEILKKLSLTLKGPLESSVRSRVRGSTAKIMSHIAHLKTFSSASSSSSSSLSPFSFSTDPLPIIQMLRRLDFSQSPSLAFSYILQAVCSHQSVYIPVIIASGASLKLESVQPHYDFLVELEKTANSKDLHALFDSGLDLSGILDLPRLEKFLCAVAMHKDLVLMTKALKTAKLPDYQALKLFSLILKFRSMACLKLLFDFGLSAGLDAFFQACDLKFYDGAEHITQRDPFFKTKHSTLAHNSKLWERLYSALFAGYGKLILPFAFPYEELYTSFPVPMEELLQSKYIPKYSLIRSFKRGYCKLNPLSVALLLEDKTWMERAPQTPSAVRQAFLEIFTALSLTSDLLLNPDHYASLVQMITKLCALKLPTETTTSMFYEGMTSLHPLPLSILMSFLSPIFLWNRTSKLSTLQVKQKSQAFELIRLLIRKSAFPQELSLVYSSKLNSPLDIAISTGNQGLIDYILSKYEKSTSMQSLMLSSSTAKSALKIPQMTLNYLAEKGAEPSIIVYFMLTQSHLTPPQIARIDSKFFPFKQGQKTIIPQAHSPIRTGSNILLDIAQARLWTNLFWALPKFISPLSLRERETLYIYILKQRSEDRGTPAKDLDYSLDYLDAMLKMTKEKFALLEDPERSLPLSLSIGREKGSKGLQAFMSYLEKCDYSVTKSLQSLDNHERGLFYHTCRTIKDLRRVETLFKIHCASPQLSDLLQLLFDRIELAPDLSKKIKKYIKGQFPLVDYLSKKSDDSAFDSLRHSMSNAKIQSLLDLMKASAGDLSEDSGSSSDSDSDSSTASTQIIESEIDVLLPELNESSDEDLSEISDDDIRGFSLSQPR